MQKMVATANAGSDRSQQLVESAAYQLTHATAPQCAAARHVLSYLHAQLHTRWCKILYSPLWAPSAAAGAGEDAEMFFSYFSRLQHTTRSMSVVGECCCMLHALPLCTRCSHGCSSLPLNHTHAFSPICNPWHAAGSEEHLTQAAQMWGQRKRGVQASELRVRCGIVLPAVQLQARLSSYFHVHDIVSVFDCTAGISARPPSCLRQMTSLSNCARPCWA